MKRRVLTAVFTMVLVVSFNVQAQNGFAVWAKGGGCERELHFNSITDGDKVGPEQLVIEKGPGADIWPVISYDGEWIAWCRSPKSFNGRYGDCDYHNFGIWDIYVARIDFGNSLPVKKIIKVANGYLPSWGDDVKTPNQPKTLYFTKYSDQTIQKTTINPDGSFTVPVVHATCPKKMTGSNAHTQGSPDGKFILYRPGQMTVYSVEAGKNISGMLTGYNPSWGPRSKYLLIVQNNVFYNTGTSVKTLGRAGLDAYWTGISNDAYFDRGRLWIIGTTGRSPGQNGAGSIKFKPVDISDGGWKVGAGTEVGSGTSCDIHMFPQGYGPASASSFPKNMNSPESRTSFSTQIKTTSSGLQLIVHSTDETAKIAELFGMQGKRVGFLKMSGSFENTIPLNGIADGKYVLRLITDNVSAQKKVLISR